MSIQTTRSNCAFRLAGLLAFAVACCSCGGSSDLNRSTAKAILEKEPTLLEFNAYLAVSVSDAEFDCAMRDGLFQTNFFPTVKGESLGLRVAHKVKPGDAADAELSDHWLIGHDDFRTKVKPTVDSVTGITEGPQAETKIVTARIRINVPHACFPEPLPVWRDESGKAGRDLEFHFRRFDDGWRTEELIR